MIEFSFLLKKMIKYVVNDVVKIYIISVKAKSLVSLNDSIFCD